MTRRQSSRPTTATGHRGWQDGIDSRNQHLSVGESIHGVNECLLAEVDLKWLMLSHGWRIDTPRFHWDASYAARYLALALASPSLTVRECAKWLVMQREGSRPAPPQNLESVEDAT